MSNNPYDTGNNPYGGGPSGSGGKPYGQQNSQQNHGGGFGRPAFVDPYQPNDNQPVYPPAVTRNELAYEDQQAKEQRRAAASISGGGSSTGRMPLHPGGSRVAATICLILAALMTLGHISVLALGVVAIFYGVAKTELVKKWSGNAFNFLLTYIVLAVIVFLALGFVDVLSGGSLHETVGKWIRYLFSILFFVGAVGAASNKYFRLPSFFRPLYS